MGLLNKVRDLMLGTEVDEDYLNEEGYEEDEAVEEVREPRERERKRVHSESNVVSMPISGGQREKMVISRPATVADAPPIADYLRLNMTCIINLEGVEQVHAQRIADFLGGASYALSCEIERISNEIFIIAPAHVGISNETKEEIKNNGVILPWISAAFK